MRLFCLRSVVVLAALCLILTSQGCEEDTGSRPDGSDVDTDTDSDTDVDGDSDSDTDSSTGCDEIDFPVAGHPPDMLIMLDRSLSMSWGTPSYWSTVTSALSTVTTQMDSQIRFGLMIFPEGSIQCTPPSPMPVVEIDDTNSTAISTALGAAYPDGGGTPTTAALEVGAAYLSSILDASPKYILLATDGAPNCSTDPGLVCPGCVSTQLDGNCWTSTDCLDDVMAVDIAQDIHTLGGIDIFVVGVGGVVGEWDTTMDAIANAGGTGAYYPAGDATALQNALAIITAGTVDCTFTINWDDLAEGTSTDPNLVNLFGDGDVIPYDEGCLSGNGWQWLDNETIELCEQICDDYADGTISTITATFGCETIVE